MSIRTLLTIISVTRHKLDVSKLDIFLILACNAYFNYLLIPTVSPSSKSCAAWHILRCIRLNANLFRVYKTPTSFELDVLIMHWTVDSYMNWKRVGPPSQRAVSLLGEESK